MLRILYSLAETLSALHQLGFSHNDIKGNNIMVDGCNNISTMSVTLIDLGFFTEHGEYPFAPGLRA